MAVKGHHSFSLFLLAIPLHRDVATHRPHDADPFSPITPDQLTASHGPTHFPLSVAHSARCRQRYLNVGQVPSPVWPRAR